MTQKKAGQGDVEAQYRLGVMIESGEGVLVDKTKAVEWYQKAAAQDDSKAITLLKQIVD
ncbi:MAG: SEL1-like repeat protein [Deltaproteobacteria bacterium]|nr:SEL1-like repeat protein [Deltaproteobacteria bacterium]